MVVVSPLRRATETALLAFGPDRLKEDDGTDNDPGDDLDGVGREERKAVGKERNPNATVTMGNKNHQINGPRFVAVELAREQHGLHICDKRLSTQALELLHAPRVDYSSLWSSSSSSSSSSSCGSNNSADMSNNDNGGGGSGGVKRNETSPIDKEEEREEGVDPLYDDTRRESRFDLAKRCHAFLRWLYHTRATEVAVVSHSSFLLTMFKTVLHHRPSRGGPDLPNEGGALTKWFSTGEVRSVMLEFIFRH